MFNPFQLAHQNSRSVLKHFRTMQGTHLARKPTEEIKLYENSKERNRLEELSDLYAIIKATELLEAAYSRDCITASEYSDACSRTISQFKTTESALISRKSIVNTEAFMKEFQIDCPRAYERLIVAGRGYLIIVV